MTGTRAMKNSSARPYEPGSMESARCHGSVNGAFQPPRNRTVVSAETMKTLTY